MYNAIHWQRSLLLHEYCFMTEPCDFVLSKLLYTIRISLDVNFVAHSEMRFTKRRSDEEQMKWCRAVITWRRMGAKRQSNSRSFVEHQKRFQYRWNIFNKFKQENVQIYLHTVPLLVLVHNQDTRGRKEFYTLTNNYL